MNHFAPRLSGPKLTEVMRLLGEIDVFKGHWRKLREIRAEKLAKLRQITTIESPEARHTSRAPSSAIGMWRGFPAAAWARRPVSLRRRQRSLPTSCVTAA